MKAERRYYTAAMLGGKCNYCALKMPKALEQAGQHAHPTCGPTP